MRKLLPQLTLVVLAVTLLLASPADSTTILKLDLDQMVSRAGRIFRGTVLDVSPGSVEVGGGSLPTVTYTFRVEEAFKGEFLTKEDGDGSMVSITMVGSIKNTPSRAGEYAKFSVLPELPNLTRGSDYLLLTTPESEIGLSTAVGLGQGAFSVIMQNREEYVVNAVNNANIGADGPIAYSEMAQKIRSLLGN